MVNCRLHILLNYLALQGLLKINVSRNLPSAQEIYHKICFLFSQSLSFIRKLLPLFNRKISNFELYKKCLLLFLTGN